MSRLLEAKIVLIKKEVEQIALRSSELDIKNRFSRLSIDRDLDRLGEIRAEVLFILDKDTQSKKILRSI